MALGNARAAVRQHRGPQPAVPLHLRNATTSLAHRMGLSFSCHIAVFSADCCRYKIVVSTALVCFDCRDFSLSFRPNAYDQDQV